MRCKKGQVVMTFTAKVRSTDYKGKKLYGNAEKNVESLLSRFFEAYVKNFGNRIAITYPDIVEVITDGK